MIDESDISVAQHEDTRFHTVTWRHALPGGGTEDVFCGQANLAEEDEPDAGKWVSGHLPFGIGGFDTLEDAAKALALSRAERGPACKGCGSYVLTGIEYAYDDPKHYDGISEWSCSRCGRRWDRFTGEIYEEGRGR